MNIEQLYRELQKISPQEKAALFAKAWGIKGGSGGTDPAAAHAVIGHDPQAISLISKDFTLIGSTDVLNVTEAGILFGIGVIITTQPSGTVPTITIDTTVDGGTTRSIELNTASLTWQLGFQAVAGVDTNSDGSNINRKAYLRLGIAYQTSLQVAINVATVVGTQGAATFAVLRGIQL